MTNEQAIKLLHRLQDEQFDGIHGDERREALEMAVRALEGDGDTISRKMAIDALSELREKTVASESFRLGIYRAIEELKEVPFAQPEIIHCNDCEYYKYYTLYGQTQGFCNRLVLQPMEIDDFCSRAERRTEE